MLGMVNLLLYGLVSGITILALVYIGRRLGLL
jgi:hypothetical protein